MRGKHLVLPNEMAKWKKVGVFLEPLFKMKCLGCRDSAATFSEMKYTLFNFPIDVDKPQEKKSYALDRVFKCNFCGWRTVFGIAVSKEHSEEIKKHEDGKSSFNQMVAY